MNTHTAAKTVVVGMSGGVDSSAAALLLKEQGYRVIGVTMQIWQEEDPEEVSGNGGCCGLSAVDDARRVCETIGIPHYVMNFRKDFRENVIDYFVREYRCGRTPNPCIACNRYVKWEALLKRSMEIGADYIATGHYAKIVRLANGRMTIQRMGRKDQSYALYNLTQEQLSRTLFPVGGLEKEEVRLLAEKAGLPVAHKPDSQEICFVPDQDYAGFIRKYTGKEDIPGNYIDISGKVLGKHRGITHYTIGQRKRLGLSMGHPVFVTKIDPEKNEIVIGENEDLMSREVAAGNVNWMAEEGITEPVRVTGKIRYNHAGSPATLFPEESGVIRCLFDEPQRAATPGQAAVFYRDGSIICGGTIQ